MTPRADNPKADHYETLASLWRDVATVFGLIATFSAVILNIGNSQFTNTNPSSPFFVGSNHPDAWPVFLLSVGVVGVSFILMVLFDVLRIRATPAK
jgi:hypothetical protein